MMKSTGLKSTTKSLLKGVPLALAMFTSGAIANAGVTNYITQGQAVPSWQMYVGNSMNYFVPVKEQEAKAEKGSLKVSASEKEKEGDALNLKWTGKKVKNEWGGNMLHDSFFTIGKNKIDISSVQDQAAIAIEIKMNRRPTENVKISMRCKYSNECKGTIQAKPLLKRLPKGEWTYLTLPLNCFNTQNKMDFKEITEVLSISTQGKLDIDVANIGLVALAAGDKGCKS